MPRFALELEYDGAPFVGWQRQQGLVSIQAVLEQAATHLAPDPVAVAAGRTDSGVHAAAMVVHLDIDRDISPAKLTDALNFHMRPYPVVVVRAAAAALDWHARFSATGRAYRYTILDRRARPALMAGRVWHVSRRLDAEAMHRAAQSLVGRHDFTSFRAASCQAKSPVRTLDRLDVIREGDSIEIIAEARSFLHHQVRNMAGTLKLVGDGVWPESAVATALDARTRAAAGPTAPSEGLCLTGVRYPVDPFALM